MNLGWVLLLILSSSQLVFSAETCEQFRLDEKGGSVSHVPIHNQIALKADEDVGVCYAVTAATLIDAFRFTHGDKDLGHVTSPIPLAAMYKVKIEQFKDERLYNKISYGQETDALLMGLTYGSCNQRKLNLNYDGLLGLYSAYNDHGADPMKADKIVRELCSDYNFGSPFQISQFRSDLFKNLKMPSGAEFVKSTTESMCRGNLKNLNSLPAKINSEEFAEMKYEERMKAFDKAFEQEPKQPVAFGMNTSVFSNNKSLHSMVVVGQSINNGQCEVLVRNSYGKDCKSFPYLPKIKCKNGQFWLSKKEFLEEAVDITYLSKK